MEVSISHNGIANNVEVSASMPNIVSFVPSLPINVEVQLFRDGKDGRDGIDSIDRDVDGGIIY